MPGRVADLEEGDGLVQTSRERHLGRGVELHAGEPALGGAGFVDVEALLHLDTWGRQRNSRDN